MHLYGAIALLSAGAVAYEILLIRLFSIIQWHHFAYMVISLALLGYGASGTALAFIRERAVARFERVFMLGAAAFGLSAPTVFALGQRLPFNPLELVWDPLQPAYLFALYGLLAVPFFGAALSIGLAFAAFNERVGALYRADLVGAGGGALGVVLVLFVLRPEQVLTLVGSFGLASAGLIGLRPTSGRRLGFPLLLIALAAPFLWPEALLVPRFSPYKELAQALRIPGAEIIAEASSPLGLVTVVRNDRVPFRDAPGLSLQADVTLPPQLGMFIDGGAMTAITRFDGDPAPLAFLDQQTAALPYHLLNQPRVLVLGAGGGTDVLRAVTLGAAAVDAVELDRNVADLMRRRFADFAGRIYDRPDVRLLVGEARGFAAVTDQRYDLIQISLLESFSASAAGLFALSESTLYTVEALRTFVARLAPGGILAITRWLKVPPRDSLKLVATARAALERAGTLEPERRIAVVRSWSTVTVLVKNAVFTAAELARIRDFAGARAFDIAYLPDLDADEANRFNRLAAPYVMEGARALLGPEPERFLAAYKFDVAPATDDRPYFFRFLKWPALIELVGRRASGGLGLLEWGYLVLVATLAQAVVASALIVVLPLWALKRAERSGGRSWRFARTLLYFGALGVAFLFIEIAFMQRFVLFLHHPLYATAVVVAGFLVFAGLGSGLSGRIQARLGAAAIPLATAGIGLAALLHLGLSPLVFERLVDLADPWRILVALALIAPIAFIMGLPFPLGLRLLADAAPSLVPWAWAINGCASVLAAVLAMLLAMEMGTTSVVVAALGLYALAAATIGRGFAGRPATASPS